MFITGDSGRPHVSISTDTYGYEGAYLERILRNGSKSTSRDRETVSDKHYSDSIIADSILKNMQLGQNLFVRKIMRGSSCIYVPVISFEPEDEAYSPAGALLHTRVVDSVFGNTKERGFHPNDILKDVIVHRYCENNGNSFGVGVVKRQRSQIGNSGYYKPVKILGVTKEDQGMILKSAEIIEVNSPRIYTSHRDTKADYIVAEKI